MKYYAVKEGRIPGIYQSWDIAEKQIKGYSKAKFKSFPSKREAELYLQEDSELKKLMNFKQIAYTDGSCISSIGGYGIVLIQNERTTCHKGPVPIYPCTNNIAELYAIGKVLQITKGPLKIFSDSLYSINVIQGEWKAKVNQEQIQEIQKELKTRDIIFEHVRAHNGDECNEMADQLANEGREMAPEIFGVDFPVKG